MNYKHENSDELVFFDEEPEVKEQSEKDFSFSTDLEVRTGDKWKILVVDDEEDVHTVTHLTLDDFIFEAKPVEIMDAFSAEEALRILRENPDTAIVLLDVVMETTTAGLDLVKKIRQELKNSFVRIILRTGQPGYAPEREVVLNYDINDYKTKTELTSENIFTLVTSGLRSFKSLVILESYRSDLQKKVEEAVQEIREKDHIIIRQSRQAAVSELISNISHQWRQPLNTVMALIQNLEYAEEITMELVTEKTEKAMEIIQNMSDTIDDLRFFFEPVEELQDFSISEVIEKTRKLISPTLEHEKINLQIEVKNECIINGYRNDYAQVALQIINNSRDALRKSNVAEKVIKILVDKTEDGSLLQISDNGGGIDKSLFEHIFEPYVTSKFKGPGRGLSLYMCQIVIEKNMSGQISAENNEFGAVFKIIV